jgi:hypothetical protein
MGSPNEDLAVLLSTSGKGCPKRRIDSHRNQQRNSGVLKVVPPGSARGPPLIESSVGRARCVSNHVAGA